MATRKVKLGSNAYNSRIELLDQASIQYKMNHAGTHLMIREPFFKADYWPTTDLWRAPNLEHSVGGTDSLIRAYRAAQQLHNMTMEAQHGTMDDRVRADAGRLRESSIPTDAVGAGVRGLAASAAQQGARLFGPTDGSPRQDLGKGNFSLILLQVLTWFLGFLIGVQL